MLGGGGGRERAGDDVRLEGGGHPGHTGIGAQLVEQGLPHLVPQPAAGLGRAPVGPRAGRLPPVVDRTDGSPGVVDALAADRRAGHHGRRVLAVQEVHGVAVVGGGAVGCGHQVAVGLVHHDHVGQLHDPPLDALELVAARRGRRGARRGRPCRPRPPRTGPTPTVSTMTTSKPAASQSSSASRGAAGHAAHGAPDGDGRMKASVPAGELGHPGLVARGSSRPTACSTGRRRARRLGGRRRRGARPRASMKVDLPAPGWPVMPTRTAPPVAASSSSTRATASARWSARVGLDQRDGPGQGPAVTGADRIRDGGHGRRYGASRSSSTRSAAFGDVGARAEHGGHAGLVQLGRGPAAG